MISLVRMCYIIALSARNQISAAAFKLFPEFLIRSIPVAVICSDLEAIFVQRCGLGPLANSWNFFMTRNLSI